MYIAITLNDNNIIAIEYKNGLDYDGCMNILPDYYHTTANKYNIDTDYLTGQIFTQDQLNDYLIKNLSI